MNPQNPSNKPDAQRNNPVQKPGVSPQGEKSKTPQQGSNQGASRPGLQKQER